MYKLIIAGGRDFTDKEAIVDAINSLEDQGVFTTEQLEIVSGMAKGADMTGYELAFDNGLAVEPFPADWGDMTEPCVRKVNGYGEYNALAGMNRNQRMGDYADGLLAFWNGTSTGTKDMIDYMRKLGKKVVVIHYTTLPQRTDADIEIYNWLVSNGHTEIIEYMKYKQKPNKAWDMGDRLDDCDSKLYSVFCES